MDAQQNKEIDLILCAKAGDKDAFGQLYDSYFKQIFRYVRLRCGVLQDAEDIVEEVFIRAWNNLPSFKQHREKNLFRAWLFRIAHNLLVDKFRKGDRLAPVEQVPEKIENDNRIETVIIRKDESVQMMEAVHRLDERMQQVIIARFGAELSHKETASMLHISPANVRVIQYRALEKLRELLGNDTDEE